MYKKTIGKWDCTWKNAKEMGEKRKVGGGASNLVVKFLMQRYAFQFLFKKIFLIKK